MCAEEPETEVRTSSPRSTDSIDPADWPPVSFAENDHILVWWLPEYDDALSQLVSTWQWDWKNHLSPTLRAMIPESVLDAWLQSDPLCEQFSWFNVLVNFAVARAKQQKYVAREPQAKVCPGCSVRFRESDLPARLIERIGVESIDFCTACFHQGLTAEGSSVATKDDAIAVLQTLLQHLGRPPVVADLSGRFPLASLSSGARQAIVLALLVKPTGGRVKELFGSWGAAIQHATTAERADLPRYEPPPLAEPQGASRHDQAVPERSIAPTLERFDYGSLRTPLPRVQIDSRRDLSKYRADISALIGTGALALAEAALPQLCQRDYWFYEQLAYVYALTDRASESRIAIDSLNGNLARDNSPNWRTYDDLPAPRDPRTITIDPVFYRPLQTEPRGNVRFVLVGGEMEYVGRRGEQRCVTWEPASGGPAGQLAEHVSRMSAMVDSEPWLQAAVSLAQALLTTTRRAHPDRQQFVHAVGYVTSAFRDIVKAITGTPPQKIADDAWRVAPPSRSAWTYQRNGGQYIFNANADFDLIAVERTPLICIWGWPDRSDLCLQAFLDTVAVGTPDPVTILLPDIPEFRDFARRYVKRVRMQKVARTLIEDSLYWGPGQLPNGRGTVLSARFGPTLVIDEEANEEPATSLLSGLTYLDAHHTLRISVWDLLRDQLLRSSASRSPTDEWSYAVSSFDRTDMVQWYSRRAVDDDADLFRVFRPKLLDDVVPA